jgi:3'(2'), 5'-bisphosphate nucleotidase
VIEVQDPGQEDLVTTRSLEREMEIAVKAVIAASRLCTGVRSSLVDRFTVIKDDRSPVTIADYGSQALICRILRDAFPHDAVVAEENAEALTRRDNRETLKEVVHQVHAILPDLSSREICDAIDWGSQDPVERFWTLDPIDGTKGFLRGEQYAVALALVENGRVQLGVLGCPNLTRQTGLSGGPAGAVFAALRSTKAFEADLNVTEKSPISASSVTIPADARMTESYESGHTDHESHQHIATRLGMTRPPLRMDSQAKYAVLARGEASVYLRLPSPRSPDYRERIWDHAAGSIIIEEAGGKVTDAFGVPLDFSQGRRLATNQGIVATNGRLHDAVLEAVRMEIEGRA